MQKPWLASSLITSNALLDNLRVNDQSLVKIIDCKVFNENIWYIARTKDGADERGAISGRSVQICSGSQKSGPFLLDPQMYFLNKTIYTDSSSGLYLSSVCGTIPFIARAGVKCKNKIFLIDELGYLFESAYNETTKKHDTPHQCHEYQPGRWLQPRFVNCFKSADEKSLFLETVDGHILEKEISNTNDFSYLRVFRTKKELEREFAMKADAFLVPRFERYASVPFHYHCQHRRAILFEISQQSITTINALCNPLWKLFAFKQKLLFEGSFIACNNWGLGGK